MRRNRATETARRPENRDPFAPSQGFNLNGPFAIVPSPPRPTSQRLVRYC